MYLVAGLFPGDPLTGAVRGRGTAVEALRPFDGDVRAAEALDGEPRVEQLLALRREDTADDVDAGAAQALRATRRQGPGIGDGVDLDRRGRLVQPRVEEPGRPASPKRWATSLRATRPMRTSVSPTPPSRPR